MDEKQIAILGIGCMLLADQGFGISMVQSLGEHYEFPDNINLLDGGLLGVGLTGAIAQADYLIVIDSIRNNGHPGDIYRLEGQQILERLKARNSVPQVEFLEALAHCQVLDAPPQTVLFGIEPEDTESLVCEVTPVLREKMDAMTACVLDELKSLGVACRNKERE